MKRFEDGLIFFSEGYLAFLQFRNGFPLIM